MKRVLCTALTALTILVAAFFASPLSGTDGLMKSKASVTFNKDVAPIFFNSCVECHRPGEAAPMSLLSYQDARPWARSIREKVVNREMPPWHADPRFGQFSNDASLTRDQIDAITAWVDGGAKEGDPRDLPPAPKFVEGWGIGQPDMVLKVPEEFTLEASGPDEYHFFMVDPGFTEDKYVQLAEARPGNRRIVHHILSYIVPPPPGVISWKTPTSEEIEEYIASQDPIFYREGFLRRLKPNVSVFDDGCQLPNGGGGNKPDGSGELKFGQFLTRFLPGTRPPIWEPGTVRKIPAGAQILFEIHYARTGKVEKDRSTIGLVFAKQPPRKELMTAMVSNYYFRIPPGAENHRVTSCWTAPQDIHLVTARPHMHNRGKAMEIKVFYPDGRSEVLLNVPRYDFSWQTSYSFKQPIAIPKGTRFMVTGYFDNSAKNKFNPDPTKAVRFGNPTYDEMMVGALDYTVDGQSLKPAAAPSVEGATQKQSTTTGSNGQRPN
jgi:mono/diheme cytochrome c family protein